VSIIRSLSVLCAEVKNGETVDPVPPYVFMIWCLIKHKVNFSSPAYVQIKYRQNSLMDTVNYTRVHVFFFRSQRRWEYFRVAKFWFTEHISMYLTIKLLML
jgi:hypothetical protein